MKKLLALLAILGIFGKFSPVSAVYDPRAIPNNKLGVHILAPSELDSASKLVNSRGGDWGYVTIPIQPTDRDKAKWQAFMDDARSKHLIPIIRITTIPQGGTWASGDDTDLVDFANFLGELSWPIENRYIILFNEVNRAQEWGGTVSPAKYTQIVKNAYTIFKERSGDFFLLGPALDLSLPNSTTSLSGPSYLSQMALADPRVWTYFDGWASHSYPNPDFSQSPKKTGLTSIVGYRSELAYLKLAQKPIFITETGWDQSKVSENNLVSYWKTAWDIWSKDPNVVAVTPFVLQGGEQFSEFSLTKASGEYSISGQALSELPRLAGVPKQGMSSAKTGLGSSPKQPSWAMPFFKSSRALFKLENIFRVIMGLPTKSSATLRDIPLTLELAQNASQWEKGLSGRSDLGELSGMLFIFPQYHVPLFWMKDMKFSIDMIWISGGKVVDITSSVPVESTDKLPTYSPKVPVNMVLETRAGWATENNIALGDQLIISD